jgi:hypothetical protein
MDVQEQNKEEKIICFTENEQKILLQNALLQKTSLQFRRTGMSDTGIPGNVTVQGDQIRCAQIMDGMVSRHPRECFQFRTGYVEEISYSLRGRLHLKTRT